MGNELPEGQEIDLPPLEKSVNLSRGVTNPGNEGSFSLDEGSFSLAPMPSIPEQRAPLGADEPLNDVGPGSMPPLMNPESGSMPPPDVHEGPSIDARLQMLVPARCRLQKRLDMQMALFASLGLPQQPGVDNGDDEQKSAEAAPSSPRSPVQEVPGSPVPQPDADNDDEEQKSKDG